MEMDALFVEASRRSNKQTFAIMKSFVYMCKAEKIAEQKPLRYPMLLINALSFYAHLIF